MPAQLPNGKREHEWLCCLNNGEREGQSRLLEVDPARTAVQPGSGRNRRLVPVAISLNKGFFPLLIRDLGTNAYEHEKILWGLR